MKLVLKHEYILFKLIFCSRVKIFVPNSLPKACLLGC